MKKALASLSTAAIYMSLALPALAQSGGGGSSLGACSGQFSSLCNLNESKFGTVVSSVVTILLVIAVVVALFYLVYGGIRWITSGGDKAKVESARNHIIAAIIGLVVAFLAYFILNVVLSFFGLNLSSIKIPRITGGR